MRLMSIVGSVVAVMLVPVLPAAPAQATNLLANGSFETWSGGYTPSNQPDRIFNDATLSVPGWNFAIGLSSDIYRDLNASGAQSAYYDAPDGDYLAGSGSFDPTHEGISQIFMVAPNTQYQLTFEMAPGGINYSGSWIEYANVGSSWHVSLTGALASAVSNTFNANLADFGTSAATNPLRWTTKSLLFTSDAAGGNVTLSFIAFGDLTHIFIDNVVVTAYQPVPAASMNWGQIKNIFR
jgi:hypothetical protein